jgi:tRNA G18 (ribose-2'-O)-methylase SpoU
VEDPQKLIPLEKLKLNPNDNILLVFGSEGEGVSRAISKAADHRIVIPPQLRMDQLGKFPFDMIDSLNVGVSAALILYHIRHLTAVKN